MNFLSKENFTIDFSKIKKKVLFILKAWTYQFPFPRRSSSAKLPNCRERKTIFVSKNHLKMRKVFSSSLKSRLIFRLLMGQKFSSSFLSFPRTNIPSLCDDLDRVKVSTFVPFWFTFFYSHPFSFNWNAIKVPGRQMWTVTRWKNLKNASEFAFGEKLFLKTFLVST